MAEAEMARGPDDGRLDAPVEEWASRLRADAASQLRRREHWLRRQAADDASLCGVLVDLAEHAAMATITTAGGGRHLGQVRGAGAEVVVLETAATRVLVAVDAVSTVQPVAGDGRRPVNPVGHRVGDDPATIGDLLSHAVADRCEVALVARGGERVAGELVAVGRDVVLVRPPDRSPLVYVRLDSLSEAVLPLSTSSG